MRCLVHPPTVEECLFKTHCPDLGPVIRGKVRDIYDLGEQLLIVATDRISASDVVMPTPIPGKGKILTKISAFWLNLLDDTTWHHLLSTSLSDLPAVCQPYIDQLAGRFMLVKKAKVLPIECIVRGYLVGTGWNDYQKTGQVCGISLPKGLQQAQQLPEPIFTPSTKAEKGAHDENISFDAMVAQIGYDFAYRIRQLSLAIYLKASEYARKRGIILADTKFEFGLLDGRLILADEVLTPDSSRFWPVDRYQVGCSPESFDKQYLRDYLVESGWTPDQPPPELPPEVVLGTQERYVEALDRLTREG